MKPIIFIIVFAIMAFGFYAWRSQQRALENLKSLKNLGVNVTFSVTSRPLMAIDTQQSNLYLLSGDKEGSPMRIAFHDIENIVFQEPRRSPQKSSDTSKTDHLTIHLKNGKKIHVSDLPGREGGAKKTLALFEKYNVVVDRLALKQRD